MKKIAGILGFLITLLLVVGHFNNKPIANTSSPQEPEKLIVFEAEQPKVEKPLPVSAVTAPVVETQKHLITQTYLDMRFGEKQANLMVSYRQAAEKSLALLLDKLDKEALPVTMTEEQFESLVKDPPSQDVLKAREVYLQALATQELLYNQLEEGPKLQLGIEKVLRPYLPNLVASEGSPEAAFDILGKVILAKQDGNKMSEDSLADAHGKAIVARMMLRVSDYEVFLATAAVRNQN